MLDSLEQTIQTLLQRAGTLVTEPNGSAENYLQGDQDSATGYSSLMT